MSISSLDLAALQKAIETPRDGFVGIADDVLSLCRKHALQLDWRDNRCHLRSVGDDEEIVIDVPLRRSGFRAVLARVAKLCDDQAPGTFSPYGGKGELSLGSDPRTILRVAWANTLGEQYLTIIPIATAEQASAAPGCAQVNAVRVDDKSTVQQT